MDEKDALTKELEDLEQQREQLSREIGIDPEKSKWSTDDFHSEKTHKLALICYKEFGKALMEEGLNLLQAPVQIILHPLSTVENIYESLKMLPHLPEIIEQQLIEFSNLPEEEQCRAITRCAVSALSFAVWSPVKAAAYKNFNLAMGKMMKTTGASKVLEKGEKVLRSGVERMVEVSVGKKVLSINQLDELAKKGELTKTIVRFDKGKIKGEISHVHFSNGSALNIDGIWKHGSKILTNAEKEILKNNGWSLPE